jgi:hypothetical protein
MSARMVSSSLNAMHEIKKTESRKQTKSRTRTGPSDREANKGKHSVQEGYW